MDRSGFVHVISRNGRVFLDFDSRWLAGLLVVLNVARDLEIHATNCHSLELKEEFRFENTTDQRVRLLSRSDPKRKPVVSQIRRGNVFDGADGNGPLGRNLKLIIHERLHDDVD